MPPTHRIFGWLLPRALAGIYFIAFGSWWMQCDALTGEGGLMPVPRFLQAAGKFAEQEGFIPWLRWPSLYWMGFSDALAAALCLACCAIALLVMAGVLQGPLLLALWAGYLSIVTTSDVFMNYQWDALLLEAGFIGMLIAPWRWFVGRIGERTPAPSRVQVLLPQALVLKLMFLSGVVKLASGDATWWGLTALQFHYETQPIPAWPGWWAHQLPAWVQSTSCAVMFVIELVMPVLLLAALVLERIAPAKQRWTRGLKLLASGSFVALMLLILGTGNYTFFNWLSILLACSALDDGCWPAPVKRWLGWTGVPPVCCPLWLRLPQNILAVVMLSLSAVVVFERVRIPPSVVAPWLRPAAEFVEDLQTRQFPVPFSAVTQSIGPFASVNTYGLFAVMTTERNEIIIEVSDDGIFFQPMEFKWKPGDVKRAPSFVSPHQPRLDWQMWFAALHPGFLPDRDMRGGNMVWFGEFLAAIVNHNAKVLGLMEPPPIPVEKIRSVRAQFYRYRFTDPDTRRRTGEWWTRDLVDAYAPKFSKRDP